MARKTKKNKVENVKSFLQEKFLNGETTKVIPMDSDERQAIKTALECLDVPYKEWDCPKLDGKILVGYHVTIFADEKALKNALSSLEEQRNKKDDEE